MADDTPANPNHSSLTTCAVCTKPGTQHCSGCSGTGKNAGHVSKTKYCSLACQKTDWKRHKSLCHTLRTLYHVAELAQELWFMIHAKTFERLIEKVEYDERSPVRIRVHEGTHPNGDHAIYHPVPTSLLKSTQDLHAILSWTCISDHLGTLNRSLNSMLRDVNVDVSEAMVKVSKFSNPIYFHLNNGGSSGIQYEHMIYTIKINETGDQCVLDVAGAHYGHHDTLVPEEQYCEVRGCTIDQTCEFGSWTSEILPRLLELRTRVGFTHLLNMHVASAMDAGIHEWAEGNESLDKVVKAPPIQFQSKKAALIQETERSTRAYLDRLYSPGGVLVKINGSSVVSQGKWCWPGLARPTNPPLFVDATENDKAKNPFGKSADIKICQQHHI